MGKIHRTLYRFLFRPQYYLPLSLFRVVFASFLIVKFLVLAPGIPDLYGETGFVQWEITEILGGSPWHMALFKTWVFDSRLIVWGAYTLFLLAAFGLLLGFKTPWMALLCCVLHKLFINTSFQFSYGVDIFSQTYLFFLIFIPSNKQFALDAPKGSSRGEGLKQRSWKAGFALRVMQLQLSFMYCSSGIEKARGAQWWNGEAMWRALNMPQFSQFDLLFLYQYPWLLAFMGWSTLVLEMLYPVFMFWRKTRYWGLAGIVGMHLGIIVFMGLYSFGTLMIILNLAAWARFNVGRVSNPSNVVSNPSKVISSLPFLFTALFLLQACSRNQPNNDWAEYLGGPDRNHYSALDQIHTGNVQHLQIAWTYEMPDSGQMQVNPLVVDGILYGVTPAVQVFALDAATGKQRWIFGDKTQHWASTSRGVAYWSDGREKRIFHTIGPNLYALDALSGQPILSFGDSGRVDLHTGLPETAKDKFIISNTPGTIFEDLIIMPVRLSEDADAAPGDIRAFDVRTGKLVWTFHTIPYPGETGYETFPPDAYQNTGVGAANCWAGMAIDRRRGILFVPTGSAAYDFYGGNRAGQNLFANCLLALDARSGKRLWHYQTTHHDIWDRDLPAPPNLVTVKHGGRSIDAVAQVTKQGYVFLFDRENGRPLFPIEEVPAPASDLPGELAWPTQPIPAKPAPFARQAHTLTPADISTFAENRAELVAKFNTYDARQFAPPSRQGTVILPGFDGGAEWGGAAADPDGTLYVNSNEMPWILTMIDAPRPESLARLSTGAKIYATLCSACHGADRKGNAASNYPGLAGISQRLTRAGITGILTTGKGMMPGFPMLNKAEKAAVTDYLLDEEKQASTTGTAIPETPWLPYTTTGYNKFLDNKGHPAIAPPWGTLSAIDLNTGAYRWQIPLGDEPGLAAKGTGTENYGGPVVTAGGLLFIAATKDEKFRAFDKKTGKLLWETTLPAAAFATPATYAVNGKQYLVLACGGTKLGTKKGNQYVAFALP